MTWLADVVCVVAFAAIGRLSHAEGLDPAGLAGTAWPFLVGVTAGELAALLRGHPRSLSSGLLVWAGAVGIGMLLRGFSGGGVELSFVIVTAVVLAVFLLGWRALAGLRERAARRRSDRSVAEGTA